MSDTNSILKVLEKVNEAKSSLYLENDKLKLRTKKGYCVSDHLVQEIKKYKSEIIELLKQRRDALSNGNVVFQEPLVPLGPERVDKIPLSFSQKRIWFIDQFEGSTHYHIPILKELIGPFDKDAFNHAWSSIVQRHEIFRTIFRKKNGEVFQEIMPAEHWKPAYKNMESWKEEDIIDWVSKEIRNAFDLGVDYMIRIHVLKLDQNRTGVVTLYHHVVMDGWSIPIIEQEFLELYQAYREKRKPALSLPKIQYKDYALWQQTYLNSELLEKKLKWWTDHLEGVPPLINLPLDYPRPAVQSTRGAGYSFSLDAQLSNDLRELARNERATLFMILLTGFKILLYRHTGQEDICVGTPVANRIHKDLEHVVGYFANGMALRTSLSGNPTFRTLLNTIKDHALLAYQHQDIPVELIIERIIKERDLSYRPLFQILFTLQNTPDEILEKVGNIESDIETRYHSIGPAVAKFDLSVGVIDSPSGIQISFEYCADLFKAESIKTMAIHYEKLLRSGVESPDTPISKLPMLMPKEQKQLLMDFIGTQRTLPEHATFIDLFEKQVSITPKNTAVTFNGDELTYDFLNQKANQLSRYLMDHLEPASNVPVLMSSSPDLLVVILGILKAGMVYVPINTNTPNARIISNLSDLKAKLLVTNSSAVMNRNELCMELVANTSVDNVLFCDNSINVEALDRLPFNGLTVASWEVEDNSQGTTSIHEKEVSILSRYSVQNPKVKISTDDLSYVIYTSGTTGRPKGVMVHHLGMLNHLYAKINDLSLKEQDCVAQTAPINFDISIWQFLAGLMVGARIHIISEEKITEPAELIEELQNGVVTIFESVPSLITVFLDGLPKKKEGILSKLRWMIPTGEALSVGLVKKWYEYFPKIKLLNAYGPTEASDDVTHYVVEHPDKDQNAVPIGRPIQNTRIYIVDKSMNLCPVGVRGEICVSGIGVGKGYWNDKEKTGKVFVVNPFVSAEEENEYGILYKTGDIGYYLEDGNIICQGRMDEQVKLRGNRIELGEIEHVLELHPQVTNSAVTVWDEGNTNKRLVAYIVPAETETFDKKVLQSYLADHLPAYMAPSLWVELTEMPLNSNDKIDKKALPAPDKSSFDTGEVVSPKTEMEKKLVEIWQELLEVQPVSTHHNFFELGGHSLKAMEIIYRIEEELGMKIPIRSMFETENIEELAQIIEELFMAQENEVEFQQTQ
ncbi:MAG: condensation domain-containing protein [Bacteroidota bacterium]